MKKLNRNAIIIASAIIAGFLLWYFRSIVGYILVSWVFSMIGQPLIRVYRKVKIGKWKMGNNLAASLTIASFFLIIASVVALFVPMILKQANTLTEIDYALVGERLEEPISNVTNRLIDYGLISAKQTSPFETLKQETIETAKESVSAIFGSVLSLTSSLLIGFFSVIFMTFFFLREKGLMKNFLSAFVPNEKEVKVTQAIDEIRHLIGRYFLGIAGQVTIITLLVSISLTILGVENALLIGLFAAFANVIPYLGPIIGATFGTFIVITSNMDLEFYNELMPIIWKVLIVFALMQLTDNFLLQPLIYSTSVKAHPLEIFIVILVGAKIYGIIGMILAIPTYTIIRVIAHIFLMRFKLVRRFTHKLNDIV